MAAARELRDRWLEQVNAAPMPVIGGKYEVSRAIEDGATIEVRTKRLSLEPMRRRAA